MVGPMGTGYAAVEFILKCSTKQCFAYNNRCPIVLSTHARKSYFNIMPIIDERGRIIGIRHRWDLPGVSV